MTNWQCGFCTYMYILDLKNAITFYFQVKTTYLIFFFFFAKCQTCSQLYVTEMDLRVIVINKSVDEKD